MGKLWPMGKSLFQRYLVVFIVFAVLCVAVTAGSSVAVGAEAAVLLGGLISLGLAFVFAKYLAGDVTGALGQVQNVIKQLEKGQAVDRINLGRADELAVLADMVSQMGNRDKAVRDANRDPLTGLANRRYLMQRLEQAYKDKKIIAVLFMDLDGFKPINDQYGHEAGDEALKIVAERLDACVRETDLLCRLGGDEFVILFAGMGDKKQLTERSTKILELINDPFWINGNRLKMGVSIGIAIGPADAPDAEGLLTAADEAMYAAKQGGKNMFRFYS